jgi:hypothetical protein
MALQTTRINRPRKFRSAIQVARAVHPFPQRRPIRNRQLKQPVPFPIQIRLPSLTRSHNNVNLFRMRKLVRRPPENRRLKKSTAARRHNKAQSRISSGQSIRRRRKFPEDRARARSLRSQMMPSVEIRAVNIIVAGPASRIANIILALGRILRTNPRRSKAQQQRQQNNPVKKSPGRQSNFS